MFTEQLQEIVVVAHNSTGNDLRKVFEENGLQVLDIQYGILFYKDAFQKCWKLLMIVFNF